MHCKKNLHEIGGHSYAVIIPKNWIMSKGNPRSVEMFLNTDGSISLIFHQEKVGGGLLKGRPKSELLS